MKSFDLSLHKKRQYTQWNPSKKVMNIIEIVMAIFVILFVIDLAFGVFSPVPTEKTSTKTIPQSASSPAATSVESPKSSYRISKAILPADGNTVEYSLTGDIGGVYDAKMQLTLNNGAASGSYRYEGKEYSLTGTYSSVEGPLLLTESDKDGKETATLELYPNSTGTSLTGIRIGKSPKQQLSIALTINE